MLADYVDDKSSSLGHFCLAVKLQALSTVMVVIKPAADKEGCSFGRSLLWTTCILRACDSSLFSAASAYI